MWKNSIVFNESINSGGCIFIIDKLRGNEIIGSSRFDQIPSFPNTVEIDWTFLKPFY